MQTQPDQANTSQTAGFMHLRNKGNKHSISYKPLMQQGPNIQGNMKSTFNMGNQSMGSASGSAMPGIDQFTTLPPKINSMANSESNENLQGLAPAQVPIGQMIPRDSIQFKTDHSSAGIMNLRNKMNSFVNSSPEPSVGPTMPGSL